MESYRRASCRLLLGREAARDAAEREAVAQDADQARLGRQRDQGMECDPAAVRVVLLGGMAEHRQGGQSADHGHAVPDRAAGRRGGPCTGGGSRRGQTLGDRLVPDAALRRRMDRGPVRL